MAKPTKIGQRGESRVARGLRRRGGRVKTSPGSRGPKDHVWSNGRKKWYIQTKTSQKDRPAWPGREEMARLKRAAAAAGATPVVALVAGSNPPEYRSAKTRRRLKP